MRKIQEKKGKPKNIGKYRNYEVAALPDVLYRTTI